MNITVVNREDRVADEVEIILYLVMEGDATPSGLDFELRPAMVSAGKITVVYGARGKQHRMLVGLGSVAGFDAERLRRAAGCAARAIGTEGYRSVAVALEVSADNLNEESFMEAWVEGWLLGRYTFDKYKQTPQQQSIERMFLISENKEPQSLNRMIARTVHRAESIMLARDWCNEPANVMTPGYLVEQVERLFAGRNVGTRIYRGEELEQFGMNGLLAVGQGSRHQPALIELTYSPNPSLPLLALVGKGMTFDMGGMNVKTGRDLSEARFDMGGACAVVGALDFLLRNESPANVVALIAIADNVPGAGALLPSSIIRYPNGLTVQVGNTDAEGRLILADALLHAQRLGAEEIIDIATLTGSIGHALGLRVAGVWGHRSCTEKLQGIGERNGDRVWPMPLVDDDESLLRSEYADLNNISSSAYGGAVAAALFLRKFIGGSVRWAHIDMANTVQASAHRGYETAGATGFGVRLLADYVMHNSSLHGEGTDL
ncbi:leucyl aminopeptidase family protein [Cohnella mopanensis]|uniref:leucyl aminopeptidase family protein n=1 Tax=Cohnella mopanensis TaxID=2911966 RepID=UPI001EF85735|nr:leucyl aminopeptidase family protein [Cohnella mopanensis]